MGIKPKYFLKNQKERQEKLGERFVDIFFIKEEIHLVDYSLCDPLSKLTDSNVFWYMDGDTAVVCVLKNHEQECITIGSKIIIQSFSSMSSEYLDENKKTPVLYEYAVVATFHTDDVNGLSSWCNNIDNNLLIKTNLLGDKCILTKNPLDLISIIKAEYKKYPFSTLTNFNYFKI